MRLTKARKAEIKQIARELWKTLDENQQAGVRVGLFDHRVMIESARKYALRGDEERELSISLMDVASENGGISLAGLAKVV